MERREVPAQNAETPQNPRDIDAFFVIILEANIQIDCLNKVTRKIEIKNKIETKGNIIKSYT